MKLNKVILYFSVLIMCFTYYGCQDLLAPEPDNTWGEEIAQSTPTTVLGFLDLAYISLPKTYEFSECATDDAVINDPTSSYLTMVGGAWGSMFDPTAIWNSSYRSIANINKFLTYAPTMKISWSNAVDDTLYRKRWTGEAYGMRAYYHFMLLRYYGGVSTSSKILGIPYLKSNLDLDPTIWSNVERPTYNKTVENVVQDLDSAILMLPMDYTGTERVLGSKNKNRLTKRIALAIKAELYMHAASPKYNGGNYNLAYCDSAIKYSAMHIDLIGGISAIKNAYKNTQFYLNDANQTLSDVLWRMNATAEATDAANMALTIEAKNYPPSISGKGQVNPTQDFVDAFPGVNGYPISDVTKSNYKYFTPYVNRDPRLDLCVVRDGGTLGTFTIKTSKDALKDGIENIGATRTGYYLKKLLRPDFSITNPIAGKKTIRPLIRYTELYLIYAEAATVAHGADWKGTYLYSARDIIKAIRNRAGIGLTNADAYATSLASGSFMDLVRNERRIELAFEGFRFWDIRRWGLETNVVLHKARILTTGGIPEYLPLNDEPRNFTTFKYFAPIPNSEILKCQKLEQNGIN
ncbi:MAG: RagB/SusD family nutrient uptake outer membrane protein [Paludibacter sp.]